MNTSKRPAVYAAPAFRTTAASVLPAEISNLMENLRESHPDLWEQMLGCQQSKTVMVLHVGGYNTTVPIVLKLLRSAHALGVPVLLVPFQEQGTHL